LIKQEIYLPNANYTLIKSSKGRKTGIFKTFAQLLENYAFIIPKQAFVNI